MFDPSLILYPALICTSIAAWPRIGKSFMAMLILRGMGFLMVSIYILLTIYSMEQRFIVNDQGKMAFIAWVIIAAGGIHFFNNRGKFSEYLSPVAASLALAAGLFYGISDPEPYLVYERVDVNLFFFFRNSSVAIFVVAVSFFATVLAGNKDSNNAGLLIQSGRNFTLLGSAIFLAGEVAGSWWAFEGWGDPWRWSRGFLFAGAMFLLSMLPLHLPAANGRTPRGTALRAMIPLIMIVILFLM